MGKELFGTDGVRGVPGTRPLDDKTLYAIGHALAVHLKSTDAQPRVLFGMDTRESGRDIVLRVAEGVMGGGGLPFFAGVITTPGVACLVRQRRCSAGVMVSASHNPWTDNGVKLIARTGMKFPDEIEAQLEKTILAERDTLVNHERAFGIGLEANPELDAEYVEFLRTLLLPGASLEGMKIVLDCANGAASRLGPELFRSLGADVVAMCDAPDGRNINAGCGSLHPEAMAARVTQERAALGVAFDGDADRAIFASARGAIVNGDGTLLAMARYLKSRGKLTGGRVVGTSMANLGLEHALTRDGLTLARTPVGDRYVLEEMLRSGAVLGGEQSGHVIFLEDSTTGDGLITALKIASLVALRGPIEQQIADLKIYPQTIVNVRVKSKPPLDSLPAVAAALAEAERALESSGRINLRYSGTEALARVMVEAEREEDVRRWSQHVAGAIAAALGA